MGNTEPKAQATARELLFVRHGETDYNRRRVRCGGDVDPPLTEHGEAQAREVGERLRQGADRIDLIIASPLRRTLHTAEIIRAAIGWCPLALHTGLIERRLGSWNGLGIDETQPWFDAGLPPPGGESEQAFRARIRHTLAQIHRLDRGTPLLVASKGVARVINLLCTATPRPPLANAEVVRFTFASDP